MRRLILLTFVLQSMLVVAPSRAQGIVGYNAVHHPVFSKTGIKQGTIEGVTEDLLGGYAEEATLPLTFAEKIVLLQHACAYAQKDASNCSNAGSI